MHWPLAGEGKLAAEAPAASRPDRPTFHVCPPSVVLMTPELQAVRRVGESEPDFLVEEVMQS
jgi:hypothetical protein